MRSIGFTFILALAAAIAVWLAGLQWHQGSFDLIFGKPPVPVGQNLYTRFKPEDVRSIHLVANGVKATFALTSGGWQASSPWQDRMDPVAAVAIIRFTLGMRVEDLAHEDKVDPARSGLGENAIRVQLLDEHGASLANYKLGRISPWSAETENSDGPVTTLFVQPRGESRDRHVYLCTGDITPLFKDGMKLLRDHRPFYFNPLTLEKINIHTPQGDLTLVRDQPQSPWRISKPLKLPTDVEAMKTLLEGLYQLRAAKVSDRNEVTLPATGTTTKTSQISISTFGSPHETVLEYFPPESPEDPHVKAIVSDRPNTVFDLPLKPQPDVISLADLPLDVNALRDPTLTHLNVASLRAIRILPSTGREILISRIPPEPWMATAEGKSFPANEENLYRLLKAATTTRAIGFESDAATDFSPWGLDRPILNLKFTAQEGEALELRFGINPKGEYFVNRIGTPTVMKVEPSLISSFPFKAHEWKHARLWSIDPYKLRQLVFSRPDQAPLVLKYQFNEQTWKAQSGNEDLSPRLLHSRANYMLGALEQLKVNRWLSPGDPDALKALLNPALQITAMEKTSEEEEPAGGISLRTLSLAPVSEGPFAGMHYGSLSGELHPFLIDPETYGKITTELFED